MPTPDVIEEFLRSVAELQAAVNKWSSTVGGHVCRVSSLAAEIALTMREPRPPGRPPGRSEKQGALLRSIPAVPTKIGDICAALADDDGGRSQRAIIESVMRLVRAGKVVRVSRGVYRRADITWKRTRDGIRP